MSDHPFEKEQDMNENADNLSQQNEANEEYLGASLNIDDSVSGMQHLDDEIGEEDALEKANTELAEAKDKYLRLLAEFDNYKRRTAKENSEFRATAGKDVIQSMLEVLDDSDRAQKQMEVTEDVKLIKEGIALVFSKLRNTLQQKGVKRMESVNTEFNPDLHEAITEIPAGNDAMVGKVIDEIEPGYYMNDKLIRHAKVVVGK